MSNIRRFCSTLDVVFQRAGLVETHECAMDVIGKRIAVRFSVETQTTFCMGKIVSVFCAPSDSEEAARKNDWLISLRTSIFLQCQARSERVIFIATLEGKRNTWIALTHDTNTKYDVERVAIG